MGAACCVATRDKTIQSGLTAESWQRNIRCSPTWSLRWDHRGRVAGEDTTINWFSDGVSSNDRLENKNELHVSEVGSPLQNHQRNRWQKSPNSEGTGRHTQSFSDLSISRNVSIDGRMEQVKELEEPSAVSCPFPKKTSPTLSSTSLSISPLPSQSRLPSSSSTPLRWPSHSTGHQLSWPVSDSRIMGFKSPSNFYVSEDGPVIPSWSNEYYMHSGGGSLDYCSRLGFTDLTGNSPVDRWSFDSESFGFNCERLARFSNWFSTSPVDLQTCGICSNRLTEKSSWSTQKIIVNNDLSVVSVLICEHVYHAECLETMTPEVNKYDPACPICTFGEKQTLKMFEKTLKAEMEVKARNKKSRNQIVDNNDIDDDDDSIVFDQFKDKRRQSKGPRVDSNSSKRSSSGKHFLSRHFSFGSKSSKSLLDNHRTRKKGFFWTKPSKE